MTLRVLIVDDSQFICKRIQQILQEHADFEVVGIASDGEQAIRLTQELNPDVVTMDIEMPKLDGISAVRKIMRDNPTPIVMFSASTQIGAQATLDALDAGAVDFLPKNLEDIDNDRDVAKKLLRMSVRVAAQQAHRLKNISLKNASTSTRASSPFSDQHTHFSPDLVLIAASTGGPVAIQNVLRELAVNCSFPVLLIQHMPNSFTDSFALRLNEICNIHVKLAENGDALQGGWAYLAPGGMQMEIRKTNRGYSIALRRKQPVEVYSPSVDITFASVAEKMDGNVLAVVLTGMGADGKKGAEMLKQKHAKIWVQDEASCTIYGMPKAVADAQLADRILSLDKIAEELNKLN